MTGGVIQTCHPDWLVVLTTHA